MKNYNVIVVGVFTALSLLTACDKSTETKDKRITQLDPAEAKKLAKAVEDVVKPELAPGLSLKLWGIDSLVKDPVSIDIDDQGIIYYTRAIRMNHSEFDIRGHQDWELASIRLQTVEEKRAFLHDVLSPENSTKNQWLADLNKDGSHDWRDMTIEKEPVYSVQDSDGDGVADRSQIIIEDFNDETTDAAGGIMKNGEDLFVGIGPDLWRIIDKDGDGIADEKTSISHGYGIHVGFSGHGMSGIEMGPEGKIYWQIGDIGFNGVDKDGVKWEHPNSGVIVRSNPDGSDFEVFAYGNRNTHEFVFDEYGNLISEDNDGDHGGERERIVYIVNGSDTGWRINWQFGKYRDPDNNTYKVWMDEKMHLPRHEGQPAYILPCIANFVNGPTGMLYNPGTALSPAWRNTFFIGEFVGNPAASGIHAFKLKPKGATFELGETKKVIGGMLATGIDFGPDGAMYLADWIEGWGAKNDGRIWKLDVDEGLSAERKEVMKRLQDDFRTYEDKQLGDLLKSPDMRVRQKAQFALVDRGKNGMEQFQAAIAQKENQLARVNAIWGISQFARKNIKHAEVLVPLLSDSDPEIRAQAAKWIGDVRYKDAGEKLVALLTDEYPRARFFAAEALGRTAYEPAITPLIRLIDTNNDEDAYIRHAASLAWARIGKPDPIVALSTHPSKAVRIAAVLALRRMKEPGIVNFLNDKEEAVVTEAARAINDDLSIEAALPALGDLLITTPYSNEPLIRRAINANLRVGTEKAIENMILYASKENAPAAMRAEAINALSTWAKPSVVDRVDGRYRGEVSRDPKTAQEKSATALTSLARNKDYTVRFAAVKAIGKLQVSKGALILFAVLSQDPKAEVRAEALKSLAALNDANIGNAIKTALADKEKNVRVIALDLLAKTDIAGETMATLLADVINKRTTEEKQAALLTLGTLPVEHSKPVFDQLLVKYANGQLPEETYLELGEAIDSTHATALVRKYKEITSTLSTDTLMGAYRGALLGGDADRGRRIFFSHDAAQCLRCHSYDDMGGTAGPRLNGVASRLKREQLLEALVDPSARLAPGFGMVSIETKDGRKLSGIMQRETASELVLKIGSRPDTTILKTSIAKQSKAASSMPPMRLLLNKKEIRDLVSFLSTLKED